MKHFPADAVIAAALILILAALTAGTALVAPRTVAAEPPLSSLSYQEDGAKGLSLWLETQNFQVEKRAVSKYQLSPEIDVVLLLQPTVSFTAAERLELFGWVLSGGHLVIAGDTTVVGQILDEFHLALVRLPDKAEWLYLQTPLLQSPPVDGPVHANATYGIRERDVRVQVHLAQGEIPTAVIRGVGLGTVVATTAAFPFSNSGILDSGNPQFVYNLIAYPGGSRSVWFDEWHHGVRARAVDRLGPIYWLFDTPAGHGILFALAVIWIGLLLAGRKFGRPLRASSEERHRAPVEYASAIARLRRRAGHRRIALGHYRQALKKSLGARYQLDPAEEDDRFVDGLKKHRPDLDFLRLRRLLQRLSKKKVAERELVVLAGEVSDWIDRRE